MSAQSIDGGLRYQSECDCGNVVRRTFLGAQPETTKTNEVWVRCGECESILLCPVAPVGDQPGREV